MHPEDTTEEILKFLDLPQYSGISRYIKEHTSKERMKVVKDNKTKKVERLKDTYGTIRNSSATAFAWRESLPFDQIKLIQSSCQVPMEKLGYTLLTKEKSLKSENCLLKNLRKKCGPLRSFSRDK